MLYFSHKRLDMFDAPRLMMVSVSWSLVMSWLESHSIKVLGLVVNKQLGDALI